MIATPGDEWALRLGGFRVVNRRLGFLGRLLLRGDNRREDSSTIVLGIRTAFFARFTTFFFILLTVLTCRAPLTWDRFTAVRVLLTTADAFSPRTTDSSFARDASPVSVSWPAISASRTSAMGSGCRLFTTSTVFATRPTVRPTTSAAASRAERPVFTRLVMQWPPKQPSITRQTRPVRAQCAASWGRH